MTDFWKAYVSILFNFPNVYKSNVKFRNWESRQPKQTMCFRFIWEKYVIWFLDLTYFPALLYITKAQDKIPITSVNSKHNEKNGWGLQIGYILIHIIFLFLRTEA